jgi:hypothetical protein
MRLNFSISDAETIREGIGRIGKVLEELVALYGTLTGTEATGHRPQATGQRPQAAGHGPQGGGSGGQVVRMPERRRRAGGS